MDTKKVISNSNLPAKLPIWSSITAALALDYWNAPEWLIGAVGLFFIVGWILIIIKMAIQEKVDVFEEVKKPTAKNSKFREKLKEAMDASDKARA